MAAGRKKWRSFLRWVFWVLVVQLVLINISAAIYAYKVTHFYEPLQSTVTSSSKNIFLKTWKIFTGPRFRKEVITETPILPYKTIHLTTSQNEILECWYIAADSAKGTVIFFHGLGSTKAAMLHEAYELRYAGYNVMLVDFRAHGNSTGNTTTLGVREAEDVKLSYDYVLTNGEKNIVLYGLSLGAVAIARCIYLYDISPSHIIMDAPFENLQMHLRARARILGFPSEPFAFLVTAWSGIERGFNGFKHNTCDYAEKIKCPVLIEAGGYDPWVLPAETNHIFSHIPSTEKKLAQYPNAGHGNYLQSDTAKWRNEITTFLK